MSRLQSRVAIVAFAAVLSASCSGSALSPTPLSPLTAASAARSVSLEGTVNAGAPPPSNVHLYLLTVAGKWVEHRMYEFNEQGQQLRGLELPAPTYKVGAMFFDRHNNAMYLASSNATSASGNVSAYDMQTGGPISLPGGFPKLWHPAGGVYDSDTHFIYVLDLLRDSGRGIMRVYDEQGNPVKTSGDFKNIGIVNGYGTYASSSIAYDSHNGRIYVLSYGTCSTCIGSISAYDGQGHQIPFSGTFGGNQLADAGILYDSSTRQIYVASLNLSTFFYTMSLYDEEGNLQSTWANSQFNFSGWMAYDEHDRFIYMAARPVSAYDEGGTPQPVAGYWGGNANRYGQMIVPVVP